MEVVIATVRFLKLKGQVDGGKARERERENESENIED